MGAATLPALYFSRGLQSIDSMEIAAVIDEEDLGEPAAHSNFERMMTEDGNSLIFRDGKFHWASGDAEARTLRGVDGRELRVRAYGLLRARPPRGGRCP